MSDDEDDIWGYKSIQKHKSSNRHVDQTGSQEQAIKSGAQAKGGGNRKKNARRKTKKIPTVRSPISPSPRPVREQNLPGPGSQEGALTTPKRTKAETVKTPSPVTPQNTYSGHCPSCQMPFSLLLVQTPRWHVSECLDAPITAQTECPDGIRCSSALPSHYKRYSHFLLAQSRAVHELSFSPPCTPDLILPKAAKLNLPNGFTPTSAKKSPKRKSPKSRSPSSSQESLQRTTLDVWLSSPSKASQNSFSSSQESSKCHPLNQQDPEVCDSAISYSPLVSDQELFSDNEDELETAKKTPHPGRSSPDKTVVIESTPKGIKGHNGGNERMMGADYWPEYSTPVSAISDWAPEGAADLSGDHQHLAFPIKTQGDRSFPVNSQPRAPIRRPQEQASQSSQAMPSVPCAKAMKQMDIGVFFGLKPRVVPAAAEMKVPLKTQSHNAVVSQNEKPPRKRKATGSFGDAGDVAENISGIPVLVAAGSQKRGGKRFRQNSNTEERVRGRKQCPFYKKIPGTGFAVDAFQYGEIEGCSAYFLTHFHSDHYGGLTKKFRFPIYCSKITGNLVQSKLRVEKEFINCLPMYTECTVNGVRVVLLDANHCPGAVLLLFILPNGTTILHTGDFRAEPSMERYPELLGRKIHTLYLDTTYCSPEYTFPPQQEAVQFAVNSAFEMVTLHPRTLVVCGTYSIGKEKVFLAIADVLGCKVCMSQDKYKTMQCLESDEIGARVTTDWHSTALHVLPMMQVHFKGLTAHLNKFSGKYDRILAFKPTGWTYSQGRGSVADIMPQIRGKVTIYGIPYSEHSSYSEMKRFVQFLKPQKIIPTVNVGNVQSRSAMEKHFTQWLSETRR